MHTLNLIKCRSFSVKAVRDTIRTTLENLPMSAPFDTNTRFPEDKIYIDLNHSVPNAYIRQLMMALDYNDRQTEKGRPESDSINARQFSNMEDAKVAFYQSVYNLLDLCGPMMPEQAHVYGVYTRLTFEETFNLKWT